MCCIGCLGLYERPSQTTPHVLPTSFNRLPLLQVALLSNGGRPSSTSSLDRRTLKAASCESDRCLALRRSARLSVSQTPSYSTYNTSSYNSGARRRIWTNDTYFGPVNNQGYSRGPEIFRAMEAIKAKEKEAAAMAIAKEQEAAAKAIAKTETKVVTGAIYAPIV